MNILIVAFVGLVPLTPAEPQIQPTPSIRASLSRLEVPPAALVKAANSIQAPAKPKRSMGRRIVGGVLGAVGGFVAGGYAGAYIGALIEDSDLPSQPGIIIGAPIGAIVGGTLGARFF